MTTPHPIIIDTDAGDDIDDVIAIASAALRPEIDLLGVTTVTHDAHRRAALVRQVLDAVGRSDVPVAAGAQFPLAPLSDEAHTRFTSQTRMNHCPAEAESGDGEDAIALMARRIAEQPDQVTLVGIGPATNLAALQVHRPNAAARVKAVSLMGGELALPRAEHNIKADPVAAARVLAWGKPVFLGTWSVTRGVVLMPEDMKRLADRRSPLTDMLTEFNERWWPHQSWKPGPVMYDLAPILWRFRPDLFTTRSTAVAVELTGHHPRGWTVATPGEPAVEVSESMDAGTAKQLLMETLLQ